MAPLAWVEAAIHDIVKSIDEGRRVSRFVLGLPNYGLVGPETDQGGPRFARVCEPTAACLALTAGTYDTETGHMDHCPLGKERYPPGRTPNKALPGGDHVFFEDLASLEEKVAAAEHRWAWRHHLLGPGEASPSGRRAAPTSRWCAPTSRVGELDLREAAPTVR